MTIETNENKRFVRGLGLSSLMGIGFLVIYYSLAVHMYASLGRWPEIIGYSELNPAVTFHARLAGIVFTFLVIVTVGVLPILLAICIFDLRLRKYLVYFWTCEVVNLVALAMIFLAPRGFLYWWWD